MTDLVRAARMESAQRVDPQLTLKEQVVRVLKIDHGHGMEEPCRSCWRRAELIDVLVRNRLQDPSCARELLP
jgi:hypothetical protein